MNLESSRILLHSRSMYPWEEARQEINAKTRYNVDKVGITALQDVEKEIWIFCMWLSEKGFSQFSSGSGGSQEQSESES